MVDVIIEGLLVALSTMSLVLGVSTLYVYRKLSTLRGRVDALESENRSLRELFQDRIRGLESEVGYVKRMFEERGSRLNLIESRLEDVESRLGSLETRLSSIQDLVLTLSRNGDGGGTPEPQPHIEDQDPEIVDMRILLLHRQGYSIRRIARELGIPKSTVHKRLKRLLGKE